MKRIGLIAGEGRFPILVAQNAKRQGISVVAIGLKNITMPSLKSYVDTMYWIGMGELSSLVKILKQEKIKRAVMSGKVPKVEIFKSDIVKDKTVELLLKKVKDKKDDTLLAAVAGKLKFFGIKLIDSTSIIKHLLACKGTFTKRKPTEKEMQDIYFGWKIAKENARMDIGQSVVVKDKAVLAVEAIEGTDEAVRRGSLLGDGNVVVVKVSKPKQDMRFDVPVIGERTIKNLVESNVAVMAIEAGKTIFMDQEKSVRLADEAGISIIAM